MRVGRVKPEVACHGSVSRAIAIRAFKLNPGPHEDVAAACIARPTRPWRRDPSRTDLFVLPPDQIPFLREGPRAVHPSSFRLHPFPLTLPHSVCVSPSPCR